eukprot:364516-Chlamydomonas_euryale.AAC.17
MAHTPGHVLMRADEPVVEQVVSHWAPPAASWRLPNGVPPCRTHLLTLHGWASVPNAPAHTAWMGVRAQRTCSHCIWMGVHAQRTCSHCMDGRPCPTHLLTLHMDGRLCSVDRLRRDRRVAGRVVGRATARRGAGGWAALDSAIMERSRQGAAAALGCLNHLFKS